MIRRRKTNATWDDYQDDSSYTSEVLTDKVCEDCINPVPSTGRRKPITYVYVGPEGVKESSTPYLKPEPEVMNDGHEKPKQYRTLTDIEDKELAAHFTDNLPTGNASTETQLAGARPTELAGNPPAEDPLAEILPSLIDAPPMNHLGDDMVVTDLPPVSRSDQLLDDIPDLMAQEEARTAASSMKSSVHELVDRDEELSVVLSDKLNAIIEREASAGKESRTEESLTGITTTVIVDAFVGTESLVETTEVIVPAQIGVTTEEKPRTEPENPKLEAPQLEIATPKTPRIEVPKSELPQPEPPKPATPKVEAPTVETPTVETPKPATPKTAVNLEVGQVQGEAMKKEFVPFINNVMYTVNDCYTYYNDNYMNLQVGLAGWIHSDLIIYPFGNQPYPQVFHEHEVTLSWINCEGNHGEVDGTMTFRDGNNIIILTKFYHNDEPINFEEIELPMSFNCQGYI